MIDLLIDGISETEGFFVKNKKYYSGVRYKKRNTAGIVAVILGIISICAISFIVWAIASFSRGENEQFKDQSRQISELKIENEMLIQENEDLKAEIEKYKNGEYDKVDDEPLTSVNSSDDEEGKDENKEDKHSEEDKKNEPEPTPAESTDESKENGKEEDDENQSLEQEYSENDEINEENV